MQDVMSLIDALIEELGDRRGLFGKKVDLERCLAIATELRDSLPDTLEQAQSILTSKAQILQNADNVAKNLLREAEQRIAHSLEDTEIVSLAQAEADRLIADATAKCDALLDHTKKYLDVFFADTESYFIDSLNRLRQNRTDLRQARFAQNQ